MSKHRLFTSGRESINLNSSRDEANNGVLPPKSKGKENTNKYPYEAQRSEKNSDRTVQNNSFPKPGAEVENEKNQHADRDKRVNQFYPRAGPVCVSDSDSMDDDDFFSKGNSNVKLPYTLQEDEFIIKYVLKGRNIFRASSVSLWKILESKKDNPKRTYQSLKNRFLKSIKPRLFTTYSYLIKDKETENIILEKYPDLKKRVVRKDIFTALNLPKRPNVMDFSDDELNPDTPVVPPAARNPSNQNQNSNIAKPVNERESEQRKSTVSDKEIIIHSREVTLRKGQPLVTVKFSKSLPKKSSASQRVGIYSKFLALKNQNKLVPCPTCSKRGYRLNEARKNPDESDSDSDSGDNFIPNSVETPNESNSRPPSRSSRLRGSLPSKDVEKSPNNLNSRKSKSNSIETKNTPKSNSKNSNPGDSQNSPTPNPKSGKTTPANSNSKSSSGKKNISSKELKQLLEDSHSQGPPKGGKTIPANSNSNSKSSSGKNNISSKELKQLLEDSHSQGPPKGGKTIPANSNSKSSSGRNNISSKELKQLLEDSHSQKILRKIRSKDSANKKNNNKPTSQSSKKSPEKTSKSSQGQKISSRLQTPSSRNLRKSVRKRVVKSVSKDVKVATTKQPRENLDVAKPTTAAAEDSPNRTKGRPYLDRRAKKSISYSELLKKPKKRSNIKLPLTISTLTHRDRFILRRVLKRTYMIHKRNLLKNKKKSSKLVKKNLKKKQTNREEKKTNLQSQPESDSLNDNYLRSLYKETVSECRKLVNSDEEERRPDQNEVRENTVRQNTVDAQGQDVDEVLKSFFMESESETNMSNSCTENTRSSFNDTASSSLADNMMKMLSRF